MEIFRKVTGRGSVLIVSLDGKRMRATLDGKQVDATLRYLSKPKMVGTKVVVAQIDAIGLTREECDALVLAWHGPVPAAPDAKYEHAKEYSTADRAFDRGLEHRETGE